MATPEMVCSESYPDSKVVKGNNLTVYVKSDKEYRKLARPNTIKSASIPIQLTEDSVELRDGSTSYPIRLPALQKSNAQAITALCIMTADGTVQQWYAGNQFGKKRFVLSDGALTLVDDYSSDLFDATMCSGDCTDIDGVIGYKEIDVSCPGQPDKKAIQLWKIPACCAGEVED